MTAQPADVTAALVELLATDLNVLQDVGGSGAPRVFADVAPQGTARPYVTVQNLSDPSIHHQAGVSGLRTALVQVDTWARDAAERSRLGQAVYRRLDTARGLEVAGLAIRVVTVENAQDTAEARDDGSGAYTFRRRVDARVWYVPGP